MDPSPGEELQVPSSVGFSCWWIVLTSSSNYWKQSNVCRCCSGYSKSGRHLHEYGNRLGCGGISVTLHGIAFCWSGFKAFWDWYQQVLPMFIFSESEAIHMGNFTDLIPKVLKVIQDLSLKGLCHIILLPGINSGQEVSQAVVNNIPLRLVPSAPSTWWQT